MTGPGDVYKRQELRLAPTNVQRRHDVIKEVGGSATRVIPILAESEKPVCIPGPHGRGSKPGLPVDIVVAFAFGSSVQIDGPVPFALDGIAMVGACLLYTSRCV